MGCISSKAITRSMSIREELKHGFKSRSLAWEDLLTSHSHTSNSNDVDHLFAFLRSSNASTTKLKASTTDPPTPDTSTSSIYLVDEDINAKADAEKALLGQPDSCKFTRSKSCCTLRENEMLGENRLDLEDRNVGGSRSLTYHTVEEYDALLERIRGTRSLESLEDCFPWDDDNDVKLQGSTCLAEVENEAMSRDSGEGSGSGSVNGVGTGWKRKAIRRGLKTLDISPPDFSAISRFKQTTLVQGQIYSPGTYVTPKFGSYNDPTTTTQQKLASKEDAIFSSELLAAFEDCMQQLQIEEDTILRQMVNSSLRE